MNPLGTRGRAQELADLLDGALGGRLSAGAGATSLASPTLASYAGIAQRLNTVGAGAAQAIAPRPEFRDALRTRLMAVAAVQAHSAPARAAVEKSGSSAVAAAVSWTSGRKAQRGLGVAAGAMASVVAVTGVAVAAGQSLPGDPFYGVKKGAEAFQLRTADGAVDKGSKHLAFAQERLSEVRGLTLGRDAALGPISPVSASSALGGSTAERIRAALRDMDGQTRTGSDLLSAAYRDTQTDVPLQILARFAGKQSSALRALLPSLPADARERGEASLALVAEVGAQASQLLAVGVCTGLCNPVEAPAALPPADAQPQPVPQSSASQPAPCGCAPATSSPGAAEPTPAPTPEPSEAPTPSAEPTPSATPSASASASATPAPLPVPVPVPVPTVSPLPPLPVPVPTPTGLPLPKAGGPEVVPPVESASELAALRLLSEVDSTGPDSFAPLAQWRSGGPADPIAL